jgi:hypothetical protein
VPGTLPLGAAGSGQGHDIVAWREEAFLSRYHAEAREVILALLDKYRVGGVQRRIYAA